MALTIGTQLGSYEITALLGKGGMGEVYRARDRKLKREVAIKILPEEFARDSDRVTRFQREAEVLASLNHPNIAGIHDVQEANGSRYLVLELVEGETLADHLKRGPIPLDEVVQISKQVVDALETAHERGIVHRDLKPGNIKIGSDGKVKVLDFGLAKVTSNTSPAASGEAFSNSPTLMSGSMGGIILGTAPYMSPEQARGKNVDARTDIWAFGCVLYEMFTSRQAFAGETTTDILAKVLEGQPKWEALPAGTPPGIRLLLDSTLSKDPKGRLQHIGDARVFLNRQSALSEQPTTAAVRDRGGRRGWFVAAALAVVLAASLVPTTLYFMRTPPELPVMRFEMAAPGIISTGPGVGPVISPDGQRIVYVAAKGGKHAIWMRTLGSLTVQQLPGTENGASPFWAPDSRHLAFYADGKLKKTDVSGGGVQVLCNAGFTVAGAWNSDGVILFPSPPPAGGILRVSDAGGDPVPVVPAPDSSTSPFQLLPQFLPDGRHFLFHTSNGQNGNLYLASLDSKATTRLMGLPDFTPTGTNSAVTYVQGYLLFSRDRTLLAQPFDAAHGKLSGDPVPIAENVGQQFSVSQNGVLVYRTAPIQPDQIPAAPSRLSWFDRKGKPAGDISLPAVPGNITLSTDGRIAMDNVAITGPLADVWVIDARGVPNKLTADNPNLDDDPIWSPDGQQVAYTSGREPGFVSGQLYQKSSNGVRAEEPLLPANPGLYDFPRDWSHNGIVFERTKSDTLGTVSDLWLLSLPEKKASQYLHNGFVNTQAQLSPDGRYIAYVTNESGSYQIMVETFPERGGKWPITAQGGSEPLWRSDGRELYYLAPDGKIMAVAVKIDSIFQAGQASELFQSTLIPEARPLARRYAVSKDGQRFLIEAPSGTLTPTENSIPITAVVNWTATLRKK